MKRFLTLLITFLYLTSMAGVGVEAHYCGGKLKSVHFVLSSGNSCCCKKKAAIGKSCCRSEVKFFKLHETHEIQTAIKIANHQYWETLPVYVASAMTISVLTDHQKLLPSDEHRFYRSDLFLSNQTLRI